MKPYLLVYLIFFDIFEIFLVIGFSEREGINLLSSLREAIELTIHVRRQTCDFF